jgi:hypothetical protein
MMMKKNKLHLTDGQRNILIGCPMPVPDPFGVTIEFNPESVRSEMRESRKRHTKKVKSILP